MRGHVGKIIWRQNNGMSRMLQCLQGYHSKLLITSIARPIRTGTRVWLYTLEVREEQESVKQALLSGTCDL